MQLPDAEMPRQKNHAAFVFLRFSQMPQTYLVILNKLAQFFRCRFGQLAKLAQEPAQTFKTASQQSLAVALVHVGKGNLQIALAGAMQAPRQAIGDAPYGHTKGNGNKARQSPETGED